MKVFLIVIAFSLVGSSIGATLEYFEVKIPFIYFFFGIVYAIALLKTLEKVV